jgi:hypothetical protein
MMQFVRLANKTFSIFFVTSGVSVKVKVFLLRAKEAQTGGRDIALHLLDFSTRRGFNATPKPLYHL